MNSSSKHPDQPYEHKAENSQLIRFGNRRIQPWTVYLAFAVLVLFFFVLVCPFPVAYKNSVSDSSEAALKDGERPVPVSQNHVATASLISKLKNYGLWKLPASGEVPRFFIKSYPSDLNTVEDVAVKKRVFLHSLLPQALFVRQEALSKRDRLESILSKIDCSRENLNFDTAEENEGQCSWSDSLAADEVDFIQNLCEKYRTTTAEGLLERVNAVPTSIILAQAALESSWGSSRFIREGNSVFGMWTWKTKGIVPTQRDEGKTHKVKMYESILESVRAYHLTLNRLEPYEQFRQLRQQTDDPLILAEGLSLYSERGDAYVEEIKKVILSNNLQKYDTYSLSDASMPNFSGPVSKSTDSERGRAASL